MHVQYQNTLVAFFTTFFSPSAGLAALLGAACAQQIPHCHVQSQAAHLLLRRSGLQVIPKLVRGLDLTDEGVKAGETNNAITHTLTSFLESAKRLSCTLRVFSQPVGRSSR